MKSYPFIFSVLLWLSGFFSACAQIPDDRPHCANPEFDQKVANTIRFSVPAIGVPELAAFPGQYRIFDTREWAEYQTSHIQGAQYLGYDDFQASRLQGVEKDTPIVLYCSIGYRSEKIGERLRKMGYTQVYNLYGSLFEWVNRGHPVEDAKGELTTKVHTYNRQWSKWVDEQVAEKVW